MTYLIIQVLTLLVAATILGFAIGWLIRAFSAKRVEKGLKTTLDKNNRTIPSLKEALMRAEADTEDRESMITALRDNLSDRSQALQDALQDQRAIEEHRDQIEEQMMSATAGLEKEIKDQADENAQCLADLQAELDGEREKMLADMRGKETQLADADREANDLQVQLANLQHDNDISVDDNRKKQAEIERLNQDLLEAAALKQELESQIAALRKELDATEREYQARVRDLNTALSGEKENLASARENAARGEAKLEVLGEQLNDRARELQRLDEQAKHQNATIDRLQGQYTAVCSESASKDADNSGKIAALESELDRQKKLAEKAEKQIREDALQRAKLQEDLNRLYNELQAATDAANNREVELLSLIHI